MLFGKCENVKHHLALSHFQWSNEIEYSTTEIVLNSIFHKNKLTVSAKEYRVFLAKMAKFKG